MKKNFPSRFLIVASGIVLCAHALVAQTTIQLFGAIYVRQSPASAGYSSPFTPYYFNTSTVTLTCPTTPSAQLSGPKMLPGGTGPDMSTGTLQPGGNLLVDNNLLVSVTPPAPGTAAVTNVCTGFSQGGSYNGQTVPPVLAENCFTSGYSGPATAGTTYPPGPLNGDNPDTAIVPGGTQTIDAAGGVPQIDISNLLSAGQQTLSVSLVDEGGILTSSSIFLTTNCTQNGVTGPATVGGNPISSADSQGLTQTFNFNTGNNQQVGFVYDLSGAKNDGSLNPGHDGAIPQTSDLPVDPTAFQPSYVPHTSFATSNCLIHDGELLSDGVTKACKLYTLECAASDGSVSGANCPVSVVENEVITDSFDGSLPSSNLPNIYSSTGALIAHEGLGLLMASDNWPGTTGGPCTFDTNSGLSGLPCPQNLLRNFSGPGGFSSTGLTSNPNSTFITIYGVPEPMTAVNLQGAKSGNWVNTSTPNVGFITTPPNFTNGAMVSPPGGGPLVPLPGAANFVPAPIYSISYGITPAGSPVPMPLSEATLGDTTLVNSPCPATFTAPTEPSFGPPKQTLSTLADGQYLLHYYAQDCAGTQELSFIQDPNTHIWSTNFYTFPVNVDATPPTVVITSPATNSSFKKGTTVYAYFNCTDALTGSGVTHCGSNAWATGTMYDTSTLNPPLSVKLNTSTLGTFTVTITASDGAGNDAIPASLTYTVTNK